MRRQGLCTFRLVRGWPRRRTSLPILSQAVQAKACFAESPVGVSSIAPPSAQPLTIRSCRMLRRTGASGRSDGASVLSVRLASECRQRPFESVTCITDTPWVRERQYRDYFLTYVLVFR